MWIVGKNNNVLRLSLISSYGTPINAIYFGDIESFLIISGKDLVQMRLKLHKEEGSII